MTRKPGLLLGAGVGLLLTAPLIAVQYLGSQVAGLPFTPFDLFDWLARVLPGGVVTAGIDGLVRALTLLGLDVRELAKPVEGGLALAIFAGIGVLAGAGWFAAAPRIERLLQPESWAGPGVALGGAAGLPMLLISLSVSEGHLNALHAAWILAAFGGWGLALAWVYHRLVGLPTGPTTITTLSGKQLTVEQVGRRQFLIRLGGAAAAITVVGAGLSLIAPGRVTTRRTQLNESAGGAEPVRPEDLPNRGAAVQPAPGTRAEYTPVGEHYRIDINVLPLVIDGGRWALALDGLVDRPLTLTINDLRAYEAQSLYVTLSCISNGVGGPLIGTTRWTGVSMQRLLADVGVQPGATHLRITSQDGFYELVSLDLINHDERVMLCYEWDGEPLTPEHGYPARIYVPDKYGMKQPKWITRMEVTDRYAEGFWVARGWDEVARMDTTSVIDTVAVEAAYEEGGRRYVPIGGIAHGGARGIAKVEVRVDGGEWVEAALRDPLSDLTWVIWRYDWPFEAGEHTFTVRAIDGQGAPQIERVAPPHPSGATGLHRTEVDL